MGSLAEQIEKGRLHKYCGDKSCKALKRTQHRLQRRRMKNPEYVPAYNRYNGWEL